MAVTVDLLRCRASTSAHKHARLVGTEDREADRRENAEGLLDALERERYLFFLRNTSLYAEFRNELIMHGQVGVTETLRPQALQVAAVSVDHEEMPCSPTSDVELVSVDYAGDGRLHHCPVDGRRTAAVSGAVIYYQFTLLQYPAACANAVLLPLVVLGLVGIITRVVDLREDL